MSNGGNVVLAMALGAGGGFLLWHLTSKDKKKPDGGGAPAAPSPMASSATVESGPSAAGSPPRVPGPCSLKLDATALTSDGERVDVPTAVARCKASGRAELALASNGPAAVYAELTTALKQANVPVVVKTP